MSDNNFLCTRCRAAMCPDCLKIADEYAALLQMRNRELSACMAEVHALRDQLDLVRNQAASWERTAKLGYPEVIQKWMDSLAEVQP